MALAESVSTIQESKVFSMKPFSNSGCFAYFVHVHRPRNVIVTYGQISSTNVPIFVYQKAHEKASYDVFVDSLALSVGELWSKLPQS